MKKNFICKIVKTTRTISNIAKEKELQEYHLVKLKEIFYRNSPIEIKGKNQVERGSYRRGGRPLYNRDQAIQSKSGEAKTDKNKNIATYQKA